MTASSRTRFLVAIAVLLLSGVGALYHVLVHGNIHPMKESTAAPMIMPQAETSHYDSVRDSLLTLVDAEDPRVALNSLSIIMAKDSEISESCHALVHEIGREAYTKYKSFGEAMKYQDDLCGSGYLHGVIESTFKNSTDLDAEMNTICKNQPLNYSLNCYHGVGHGLMYFTQNDLPKSLSLCSLYKDNQVKISCSEGVFMENFSTDRKLHTSLYLDPAQPEYPCKEQNLFFKGSCYFYSPIYYLYLHPNDYLSGFDWCDTLESAFQKRCVSGMASRAMKQHIFDRTTAEKVCIDAKKEDVRACLDGLVSYYLLDTESLIKGRSLCDDFLDSYKTSCLSSVQSRKDLYSD